MNLNSETERDIAYVLLMNHNGDSCSVMERSIHIFRERKCSSEWFIHVVDLFCSGIHYSVIHAASMKTEETSWRRLHVSLRQEQSRCHGNTYEHFIKCKALSANYSFEVVGMN